MTLQTDETHTLVLPLAMAAVAASMNYLRLECAYWNVHRT